MPSFTAPALAAAGAAAVSVPIIIHLLARRRRRPEPWAAMRFLMAAYRRHRTRLRLEQLLLLLLRCLIVLLLGMALAGPLLRGTGAAGLLPAAGRSVVLVVDNSIGSSATDAAGGAEFDALIETADRIIADLGPADRVGMITTGRPAQMLIAPPTADRAMVRRRLTELYATPAASELGDALGLAMEAMEDGGESGPASVVVLSGLRAGTARVEEPLPRDLEALGRRATLLALEPRESLDNIQIESMRARQELVMPDAPGEAPSAMWEVTLRRFGSVSDEGSAEVQLMVPQGAGLNRTVRFDRGAERTEIVLTTPLSTDGPTAVTAVMRPGRADRDAVEADNQRVSVVDVRQRMDVLIVAPEAGTLADGTNSNTIATVQWLLSTALRPVVDLSDWPIELDVMDPARMDASALGGADVAIVLRPDLLGEDQWAAARRWCGEGGVMWITAPPARQSHLWPQQLTDAFGLGWSIAIEPTDHDPATGPATGGPTPAALMRLSADLEDMLRPVRFYTSLMIEPATVSAPTEVLLSSSAGRPLMLSCPVDGRGRLVVLATALDESWTNLPTRPLFVPLVHEVLRWTIARTQPARHFEPGDQPLLAGAFAESPELISPTGRSVLLVAGRSGEGKDGAAGEGGSFGLSPIEPLSEAGLYQASAERLAVNVSSNAADTRTVETDALKAWLGACGDWQFIDAHDPVTAMEAAAPTSDLSGPLLWILLAMVIVEILLARRASHASTAGQRTLELPGRGAAAGSGGAAGSLVR
ncbi:MAG: hypothetical protein CMJ49_06945 [Planctomycetaceae bacterium]|nr:hypothetical protein [Planctomycetaceae bacterium]